MPTLPTLTENNTIDDPQAILSKVYEYFLTTRYSDTVVFSKNLSSLEYLIQEYTEDDLIANVSSTLMRLYNRYFDDTVAEVDIIPNAVGYKLTIDITVMLDGKTYTLSRTPSVLNDMIHDTSSKLTLILEDN